MLYKGVYYYKKNGLWEVVWKGSVFVVALDDSKLCGRRRIVWSKNNEESCKEFIDLLLGYDCQ